MRKIRPLIILIALVTLTVVVSYHAMGQSAAAATNAAAGTAAAAAKPEKWNTLWEMWVVGGPVMWPIGLTSVLALGFAVYAFVMTMPSRMLRLDVLPQIQDSLQQLKTEEALGLCNANPSFLTNILAAGLQRINDGVLDVDSMEKAMEEAAVEETNEGMKPLNHISTNAQIAPMLGLLGTVTGMIGAFSKIGMGAMGDPEKLADDIGEAMITTAAGLIVGIPAMFVYFWLKGQYIANCTKASRLIGDMVHHLVVASRRPAGAAPAQATDAAAQPAGETA